MVRLFRNRLSVFRTPLLCSTLGEESRGGSKFHFSDIQLQILYRGGYGCSEVQFFNPNFPKMGNFWPKFCIFGRKFSDKKKIVWQSCLPHLPWRSHLSSCCCMLQLQRRAEQMKKNLEQQEKELEDKIRAFEAEREAFEEQYKPDEYVKR